MTRQKQFIFNFTNARNFQILFFLLFFKETEESLFVLPIGGNILFFKMEYSNLFIYLLGQTCSEAAPALGYAEIE